MCGICAVINFNGLTEKDLADFTHTFIKSESRGHQACGVGLQDMHITKTVGESSDFAKTDLYKNFIKRGLGQKWIVGHTRHATQGDPKVLHNDHPISSNPKKYWLVHNGVVGTDKFPENNKFTDSYVIADAVANNWVEGDLRETIKKAYSQFWGYAATIIWTPHEIVLTAANNPVRRATTKSGAIVVASDTDFFPEGVHDTLFLNSGHSVGFDEEGKRGVSKIEMLERSYGRAPVNWDYFVGKDEDVNEEKDEFDREKEFLEEGIKRMDYRKPVKVDSYDRVKPRNFIQTILGDKNPNHRKEYPRHSWFRHKARMDELRRNGGED